VAGAGADLEGAVLEAKTEGGGGPPVEALLPKAAGGGTEDDRAGGSSSSTMVIHNIDDVLFCYVSKITTRITIVESYKLFL
jgi:hypothetical protein